MKQAVCRGPAVVLLPFFLARQSSQVYLTGAITGWVPGEQTLRWRLVGRFTGRALGVNTCGREGKEEGLGRTRVWASMPSQRRSQLTPQGPLKVE